MSTTYQIVEWTGTGKNILISEKEKITAEAEFLRLKDRDEKYKHARLYWQPSFFTGMFSVDEVVIGEIYK